MAARSASRPFSSAKPAVGRRSMQALPEETPASVKEEKRSITQRLHENRERINQEQAQKKNKSRRRSDMEL